MVAALKSRRCDEFTSRLDAHPDDWEYRLVYADWLEEQGDVFCETQRWMVAMRVAPYFCDGIVFDLAWVWWCGGVVFWATLPGILNKHLCQPEVKHVTMHRREYQTRHAAELDLHNALVKSGEISCALIEEVEE